MVLCSLTVEVTIKTCLRGNRAVIKGYVLRNGQKIGNQEVWLLIDAEYTVNSVTWHHGQYWFYAWLSGPHLIAVEAYNVWDRDRPVKVQSRTVRLVFPFSLRWVKPKYCDGKCGLRWEDVWVDVKLAAKELSRRFNSPVYLYSSMVQRKYTCNDIDLYLPIQMPEEQVHELRDYLSNKYCLRMDVTTDNMINERPWWFKKKLEKGVVRIA